MVRQKYEIEKSDMGKLFHVSCNPNLTSLIPLIPANAVAGFEDYWTPRICFSTSIGKCLMAMEPYEPILYVFTPLLNEKYHGARFIKPSPYMVTDADFTDEHWCLNEIDVECIGSITNWRITEKKYKNSGVKKRLCVKTYEYDFTPIEMRNLNVY
ncbi:MAG: hypothetical protein PHF63_00560 [Herbinix sp.]|nr:hypothetical protein [Herbinix sp.]